jgi:hypothetical protein
MALPKRARARARAAGPIPRARTSPLRAGRRNRRAGDPTPPPRAVSPTATHPAEPYAPARSAKAVSAPQPL